MTWLVWPGAAADLGHQGIDYVELTTFAGAVPPAARLLVHLQRPFVTPFTSASFRIAGGAHEADVVFSVPSPQPGALPPRTVAVDLAKPGDTADYVVTLLSDPDGRPVHPFFASATFRFRLECDGGDSRASAAPTPRARDPRPAVDLLTKDFAGFVRLLSEWVKVKNPHWADLSPASLERVLVEDLAHHGDQVSYYQDRVANESFLDGATQRHSLRQHALLLGTRLFDGSAAESIVAFTSRTADGFVAEGRQITTPIGAGDASVVFHTTQRARVVKDHSCLRLAAWPGAGSAEVPAGATELLLWGHQDRLLVGQRLAVAQGLPGQAGSFVQVVTISSLRFVHLAGWSEDPGVSAGALPSPLTVVAFEPPLERAVSPWSREEPFSLYGNVADVRHGEERQLQGGRDGQPGIPLEAAAFHDPHGAIVELRDPEDGWPLLRAFRLPDGPVLFRAVTLPSGFVTSEPLVEVGISDQPWQRVEHLHGSEPFDRHYVATADEDGSLWLHFGDGVRGAAVALVPDDPAAPAAAGSAPRLEVRFRVGDPIAGNCGAGVLSRFVPDLPGLEVVNLVPGRGGRERESLDAARLRLPASLRHGPPERAVALADYARAALTVDGVARATARNLGGPFNAVLVLVEPAGRSTLDDVLAAAVHARIDALRMTGREHFVCAPRYVPVEVKLAICVEPGSVPHRVREAVLAALRPGSERAPGFFHPDRTTFGDSLDLDEVLAVVQRIPGVRAVKPLLFRRTDLPKTRDVFRHVALAPTEVIRMDADPRFPERGRLDVLVTGLDPGVRSSDYRVAQPRGDRP